MLASLGVLIPALSFSGFQPAVSAALAAVSLVLTGTISGSLPSLCRCYQPVPFLALPSLCRRCQGSDPEIVPKNQSSCSEVCVQPVPDPGCFLGVVEELELQTLAVLGTIAHSPILYTIYKQSPNRVLR